MKLCYDTSDHVPPPPYNSNVELNLQLQLRDIIHIWAAKVSKNSSSKQPPSVIWGIFVIHSFFQWKGLWYTIHAPSINTSEARLLT